MAEPLHVQHLLYEPRRSGISRHVLDLVRLLPELRHSVVLPSQLRGVADELRAEGATVDPAPMASRVFPRSTLGILPARIRARRADLVHVHALEAGGFGVLAARRGGARRIAFTPQTLDIRKAILRRPFLRLVRELGRETAAWIAVSRGQVPQLEGLAGDPARVFHVPNAVPPPRPLLPRTEARNRLGWPRHGLVVACVGRLSAQKDPWTFARAAARLPHQRFVLVGSGPLRGELAAFAAGRPQLRLQGFVREIDWVYAAADLVVLASRWEGLPYALLEAMSQGVPVIASRISGNVDLVREGETGLLVEPGDVRGVVAAVERLARDPGRRAALGARGRAWVRQAFGAASVAARQRAVYAQVASRV